MLLEVKMLHPNCYLYHLNLHFESNWYGNGDDDGFEMNYHFAYEMVCFVEVGVLYHC